VVVIERLENSPTWDKELESFKGSIFMSSSWITVISNNERKPVYLRFIEDDKLVALAGGIELPVNKGPGKQLFFYSGIASGSTDASLVRKCKSSLYEYAKTCGYQRISMRSYDDHSYLNARVRQFRERERMEYVIYFGMDNKQFCKCFDRDLRRRVRKAKKEGAVFRESNSPELIEVLFALINETYHLRQSKGYGKYNYLYLPFFSSDAIEKLLETGQASFFYVEKDEEIMSIQLVILQGGRAYCTLMGTSMAGYREAAPSFLFYELAMTLKDMGYYYMNIGGVPRGKRQTGLKKFKDSLGAAIVKSAEAQTDFISFPLSYFNPLLELKRFIRLKPVPGKIRMPFLFFIDLIVQKRDGI
jgi:hypothetical protein